MTTRASYLGVYGSPCGYCGSKEDTSISERVLTDRLDVTDYQMLVDKAWRRCGAEIYRPVYPMTCCKPYTIRLNANTYNMSKSHRKVFRKFIKNFCGIAPPDGPVDLPDWFYEQLKTNHILKLQLLPATFDQESFELYKKYQTTRHGDAADQVTPEGYRRFLIDSPLATDHSHLGTFHQRWYWDRKLIAVGVLDIIPNCVSSVYFFYDPDLSKWSLGTVSALAEIGLVKQLAKDHPALNYYYLGYYIEDCSKMRYKGDFQPSQLLNPKNMEWLSFDVAKATIIGHHH